METVRRLLRRPAGAGVRLTRHLGLDLEVLYVSGLDLSEDDFFILPLTFAPPIDIEREGGLTAFLTKLNVDFQVGDRLIPFVSGGGGLGRLSEEISFDVDGRNDTTDVRQRTWPADRKSPSVDLST